MKTRAVRLYGVKDLRLEEFELPPIKDGEILAMVISDSVCMSSYKAAEQGTAHKRVPDDVNLNPIIIGHEFCGKIIEVGKKWADKFKPGDKFSIQPAINDPVNIYAAPGYSFKHIGGAATYVIIPEIVMERGCLLPYAGDAYFYGSLAEPVSCIIGGFNVNYHTVTGDYTHIMGIKENSKMAILGGTGPMGLGAIDYAINNNTRRPSLLVVTDIDDGRLKRAASIYSPEAAAKNGVTLKYVNTSMDDVPAALKEIAGGGYDDVYVYSPVKILVEQADAILGYDGCLNFFAGPSDPNFSVGYNFYNVHYLLTHVAGNSGGTTGDMIEALDLMASGKINPAAMVTHIGGIDAAIDVTLNLPSIRAGKMLIYNHIDLKLTAIADMAKSDDPLMRELGAITAANNGLWCAEAERRLLSAKGVAI